MEVRAWMSIINTYVHGFFHTDLHKVSWHFATHEAVRPSGSKIQLTEQRLVSKNPFKMGFCFHPILKNQIQPFYPLKNISKDGDLSSTIAMTAHCFGALSQVRATGHCMIGQERDILWPDWLIGGCVRGFQRLKYKFSSHRGTHGQVWDNNFITHKITDVITYSCPKISLTIMVNAIFHCSPNVYWILVNSENLYKKSMFISGEHGWMGDAKDVCPGKVMQCVCFLKTCAYLDLCGLFH